MAISRQGTDTNGDQLNGGVTLTVEHTLVAGSDRKVLAYLLCISDAEDPDFSNITGVTYGGNAMTLGGAGGSENDGFSWYLEIWYIDEGDLPANGARDMVMTIANEGFTVAIQMAYIAQYAGIASGAPDQVDDVEGFDDDVLTVTMTAIPSTSWAFSNNLKLWDGEDLQWSDGQVEQHDAGDEGIGILNQGVAELQGGSGETSLTVTNFEFDVDGEWFLHVAIWDEAGGAPPDPSTNRVILTG